MRKPVATTRLAGFAATALLAALAACSDLPEPLAPRTDTLPLQPSLHAGAGGPAAFRIYSHNIYLGGDTGPIFTLDFGNLPEVLAATNAFWSQVLASDPAGRVTAVVDEIARREPHLVGLQEVFDFAVVDLSTGAPQVVQSVDYLEAIQAGIDARALPYEVLAVQENTTTGPASGLPLAVDPAAGTLTRILQFTDRLAVLRRTDVPVEGVANGTYAASFTVGPLTLERGWIRVEAKHRGTPHHFITTHLEIQALAPVQAAQADELLHSVASGLEGVTILAGDLNSDAAASPGSPTWTPTYDTLIEAGFTDAWVQAGQSAHDQGLTCCQASDLRNASSLVDQRIDLVLVRSAANPAGNGLVPGSVMMDIVARKSAGGLWASDHSALATTLRLAPIPAAVQ